MNNYNNLATLKRHIILLFLLFGTFLSLFAQEEGVITGKVTDESDHSLEIVNVAVVGSTIGTSTGKDGMYELKVPAKKELTVVFSFVGYENQEIKMSLQPGEKKVLNIKLDLKTTELPGFEIRDDQIRQSTFIRLDPKDATLIPTLSGGIESMIKTMPGVSSTNELSSQYSVRGGNFDENLVYVNGIEIYRPQLIRSGEQEGLSFINSNLVSSILFSAGGFDAKYGDKMSSVLDIQYRKPVNFAGSAEVSLLGAQAHAEGLTRDHRFTYLIGARYKSTQYILKGLETKGDYRPNFFDIQSQFTFDLTEKAELSFLGYYSRNSYNLVPESRETNFGTIQEAYRLKIYFDGQEVDKYKMYLGALSLSYKPEENIDIRFIASAYQSLENETFDVRGQYWIGKLENAMGGDQFGNVTEAMGIGTNMTHARNFLDARVASIEHKGSWINDKNNLQWGIKYQHEWIDDKLNEWELIDSAGYSMPNPPTVIGGITESVPSLELFSSVKSTALLSSNRYSGYVQNAFKLLGDGQTLALTAGIRFQYWDYNKQFLVSPRATLSYKPAWKKNIIFRFSAGYYYQPPFYKELRDLEGVLHTDVKAQKSIHFVLAGDYTFIAWNRPFKFVTEVYYKYMDDLIPYIVDNVRIRYYATNNSHGYATGIDMKINGEFIKGIESWASLSVMKTEEDIKDDFYYNYYNESGELIIPGYTQDAAPTDSVRIEPGYIPRPTDQRFNFSLFFQDYLPKFPTYKMHLTLIFGTGMPFGPPDAPKYKHTLRFPTYRRVDIGFSKQLISERTKFKKKNPLKFIRNAWISLEVFNLLGVNNTVSYIWVTDVNNRQYAVPNYLTPRQLNLRLVVDF